MQAADRSEHHRQEVAAEAAPAIGEVALVGQAVAARICLVDGGPYRQRRADPQRDAAGDEQADRVPRRSAEAPSIEPGAAVEIEPAGSHRDLARRILLRDHGHGGAPQLGLGQKGQALRLVGTEQIGRAAAERAEQGQGNEQVEQVGSHGTSADLMVRKRASTRSPSLRPSCPETRRRARAPAAGAASRPYADRTRTVRAGMHRLHSGKERLSANSAWAV